VPPSLVSGQIAINEADGKLFYRNGSGVVTQLATGGGGGGTELFPYANTASFPATGATTALYLSIASGRVYQWNGSVYSEVGPVGGGGSLSATVTIPASGDQYWSNTQLLLRGDTAVDSSSYARTVTAYGGATVSTSQKKFGGGALSFAAVGDYYFVPSSADLSFDTGDFTMEAWVRPTAFPVENGGAYISSFLTRQAPGGHGWRFELRGTSSSFTHLSFTGMSDNGAGEQTVLVSYSFSLNQWYHVAASRVGGVIYLFVDGVLQNTGGTSFGIFIQNASSDIRVGSLNFDITYKFQFFGQIDDARITKGTGRYAATFTPPTEAYGTGTYVAAQTLPVVGTGSVGSGAATVTIPGLGDPYYDNVSLLLHFNGNLTDTSATPKTVTAVGNAAATGVAKFGSASLSLDGNGDGLSVSDGLPRGSEDFTIEFWVYKNTAWTGESSLRILYEWADNAVSFGVQCYLNNSNDLLTVASYGGPSSIITYAASNFSAATWYHLAVTRSGSTMTLWVNGTAVGTGSYSGAFGSTPGIQSIGIGSYLGTFGASGSWPGRIDDFRVTRGVSRYASTFTPPAAAFADGSGVTVPVVYT
jgi:hypothetical protein